MPPNEPATARPGAGPNVVLLVGSACAVLIRDAAGTAAERDAQAEAALRAASGRGDLVIQRRASGRPRLAPPLPELGVSLSHRGALLLAALSPTARVGADVEPDKGDLDPAGLAADNFAPGEARLIAGLGATDARDAFLRMWVAKEAALKVTGRGIYDGLDQPDLSTDFARLVSDGVAVEVAASGRLPRLRLAVRRIEDRAGPAIYCGLAEEAPG